MKKRALELNGETVIFTFWPHPRIVISGNSDEIYLLNSLDEKIALFQKSGIDHLIIFPFTKEFAQLSSYNFVKDFLVEKIGVNHLVFGYDHQFGKNREGSFQSLEKCAEEFNFSLEQIPAFSIRGENISSTKIRKLISEGNLLRANEYLGYNYYLKGSVVGGMKLGRKIGFPTANIALPAEQKLLPVNGVYAVCVRVEGEKYNGMMNIGYKPTVSSKTQNLTIEVHIIDFNKDIYNKSIEIEFITKIREEKKFDSLSLLVEQLNRDRLMVLNLTKNLKEVNFFS